MYFIYDIIYNHHLFTNKYNKYITKNNHNGKQYNIIYSI